MFSIFSLSLQKIQNMKRFIIVFTAILLLLSCSNLDKRREEKSYVWTLIPDSVQLYQVAEAYPDSIIVAFTRSGKFEDSVVTYKQGFIKDSLGNTIPAYIFKAAVGDVWVYDSDGNFVEFIESELPHSDQGHTYNP